MKGDNTVPSRRMRIILPFAFLLMGTACGKDPAWLTDFRSILNRINRDLEAVIPMLSPDSSPQQVFVALTRLDETLDYVTTETSRVYQQYPDIPAQAQIIEKHLDIEFKKLRENAEKIGVAVHYWFKKLQHKKEFDEIFKRIGKKMSNFIRKTERN